jgi:hypothetical protein
MKIFGAATVMAFLVLSSSAHAYLYEGDFYRKGADYISLLQGVATDNLEALPADQKAACQKRYEGILDDGVIDIRIPIGYFDWTIGRDVVTEGNNYGLSPSIDIGAYSAMKKLLTATCRGSVQFCGFRQDGDYKFSKQVNVHGRGYQVRLEMGFSSVSESFATNMGRKSGEQTQRSSYMEDFFKSGLRNADAVFYLGHSRNGGGPDFKPPVLIEGMNKVNYKGYYQIKRPGYGVMMAGLSGRHQPAILGLMSCDSRDHFVSSLRSAAPRTGVISSTAVITIDEVYTALIGGVDALLRGQCQKTFYKSLRLTPRNQTYITMDGVFE